MKSLTSVAPERLYADAVAKSALYARVSLDAATRGDLVPAVTAQWCSDLTAVQSVVWQRLLVASPHPEKHFRTFGAAVYRARLGCSASGTARGGTAADVVRAARAGLHCVFDSAIARLIPTAYADVEHLAGLPAPTRDMLSAARDARLAGLAPDGLVALRKQEAASGACRAVELYRQGDAREAIACAYQGDLAAFEAYLIDTSLEIGDEPLSLVTVRWDAACLRLAEMDALPSDLAGAVSAIRGVLTSVVNLVEQGRLTSWFAPIPE